MATTATTTTTTTIPPSSSSSSDPPDTPLSTGVDLDSLLPPVADWGMRRRVTLEKYMIDKKRKEDPAYGEQSLLGYYWDPLTCEEYFIPGGPDCNEATRLRMSELLRARVWVRGISHGALTYDCLDGWDLYYSIDDAQSDESGSGSVTLVIYNPGVQVVKVQGMRTNMMAFNCRLLYQKVVRNLFHIAIERTDEEVAVDPGRPLLFENCAWMQKVRNVPRHTNPVDGSRYVTQGQWNLRFGIMRNDGLDHTDIRADTFLCRGGMELVEYPDRLTGVLASGRLEALIDLFTWPFDRGSHGRNKKIVVPEQEGRTPGPPECVRRNPMRASAATPYRPPTADLDRDRKARRLQPVPVVVTRGTPYIDLNADDPKAAVARAVPDPGETLSFDDVKEVLSGDKEAGEARYARDPKDAVERGRAERRDPMPPPNHKHHGNCVWVPYVISTEGLLMANVIGVYTRHTTECLECAMVTFHKALEHRVARTGKVLDGDAPDKGRLTPINVRHNEALSYLLMYH